MTEPAPAGNGARAKRARAVCDAGEGVERRPDRGEAAGREGVAAILATGESDMSTLTYAGIGARVTPAAVLADMTVMARWLARTRVPATGWHLASGGASGADSAFAAGAPAGQRTIWLPWPGYNGHRGPDCLVLSGSELRACMAIAADLHPAWDRCSRTVRKLHARNVAILLGETCDRPVDAVACWTPGGVVTGGTGLGIRIAEAHGIPVLNLGSMSPRDACERLVAIRRAAAVS